MREIWKDITEFPGYAISNLGNVHNTVRGSNVAPTKSQQGQAKVGLFRDGKQHQRAIAGLVARAFLPGETEIFDTPINLNGERLDNRLENLAWRPRWFAIKYHKQFIDVPPYNPMTEIYCVETEEIEFLEQLCINEGLLQVDVMKACVEGVHVFPTGKHYSFVAE